jgi:phosphoglycerate dehydrogenase-like enzyme
VRTLQQGQIAGAGLDVFDEEPLPLTHALRALPNTVITPHLGYVTQETSRIFYGDALENIHAHARGERLREVTP